RPGDAAVEDPLLARRGPAARGDRLAREVRDRLAPLDPRRVDGAADRIEKRRIALAAPRPHPAQHLPPAGGQRGAQSPPDEPRTSRDRERSVAGHSFFLKRLSKAARASEGAAPPVRRPVASSTVLALKRSQSFDAVLSSTGCAIAALHSHRAP